MDNSSSYDVIYFYSTVVFNWSLIPFSLPWIQSDMFNVFIKVPLFSGSDRKNAVPKHNIHIIILIVPLILRFSP